MGLSLQKMIDIPPVWLLFAVMIAYWQAELVPVGPPAGTGLLWFGGALVTVGLVLIGLAAMQFRRHKTTIIPHLPPSALVNSGIFARTRNPIYLADCVILTGLCLRWGAYPSLLLVPIFMALIQARFILPEEARLRAEFGEPFNKYVQKVRRWL